MQLGISTSSDSLYNTFSTMKSKVGLSWNNTLLLVDQDSWWPPREHAVTLVFIDLLLPLPLLDPPTSPVSLSTAASLHSGSHHCQQPGRTTSPHSSSLTRRLLPSPHSSVFDHHSRSNPQIKLSFNCTKYHHEYYIIFEFKLNSILS